MCDTNKLRVSDADKMRKQVATLASFGGHALRSGDVGELLQEATRLVSDALEVELVKVLELLPDKRQLLVRAGVNWKPGVVGRATISADKGSAAGYALLTDEPVISDVVTEKRFSIPRLLLEHGVESTINVVIRGDDGPFGVLEVDLRERRSFGEEEAYFLQNYANLIAAAVDRLGKQREVADSLIKQDMLLHELQHRVNNMLMTIRAVARLTRAKSSDLDEFAKALDARLSVLARSHDLLSQPGKTTTLRELLSQELSAEGAKDTESYTLDGPSVLVPATQAQLLSMVFHELATNAVKHGALSMKEGRIEVAWDSERNFQAERLRIRWRERGVAIKVEPVRRGFGSEILEKSIPSMLQGRFERRSDG